MSIAIIGAGNVGVALTRNLAAAGREVVVGTRDPGGAAAVTAARAARGAVPLTGIAEALEGAEVAILAMPGTAMDDLLATHGPALDGKIVDRRSQPYRRPRSAIRP